MGPGRPLRPFLPLPEAALSVPAGLSQAPALGPQWSPPVALAAPAPPRPASDPPPASGFDLLHFRGGRRHPSLRPFPPGLVGARPALGRGCAVEGTRPRGRAAGRQGPRGRLPARRRCSARGFGLGLCLFMKSPNTLSPDHFVWTPT